MPALTVDDYLVLPRVPRPDARLLAPRSVWSVTTAPSGLEGNGYPVRRAFVGVKQRFLDPFIHMEQMGEVEYAAGEPKGTPWHPHRGFETVTYMIDGVFEHADSAGGTGAVTDGDTEWMTAGSGILHIEAPPERLVVSGGLFHGIQLWINLPSANKRNPPRYLAVPSRATPLLSSADGGALLRVLAGELADQKGPGVTFTPITLLHATVHAGARISLPWRQDFNALGYVLAGQGDVGPERSPIRSGQLAVFGTGDFLTLGADQRQESRSANLEVLLLGGRPIREPVARYGPFVMNTSAEIVQAVEDYRAGRFGVVPAERIPHAPPAGSNEPA